ncbi:DddA-like double-stranded DNA deaminase toxin [Streptomyces varsoviensis]|uniref:DddA-like double-stranded DNA deaminase toxin n=1 Tax=Streptomyces varsoviensis TaxID=67373 RepID=UPI003D15A8C1
MGGRAPLFPAGPRWAGRVGRPWPLPSRPPRTVGGWAPLVPCSPRVGGEGGAALASPSRAPSNGKWVGVWVGGAPCALANPGQGGGGATPASRLSSPSNGKRVGPPCSPLAPGGPKFAAWMRQNKVKDATVVINQDYICTGFGICPDVVTEILPVGSTMKI